MSNLVLELDSQFGNWLAGFAAGEGSFNICKSGSGARFCNFRIALHEDDLEILEEIQEKTGLGTSRLREASSSMKSSTAIWTVGNKSDCLALVFLFEDFPLLAKKQRDFEVWAQAVRLHNLHRQGDSWDEFDALRVQLHECRPQRGRKAWVS